MANSTSAPEAITTAAPDPDFVAERLDFWARAATGSTTCGYINGNITSPVTCGEESSCLSFTSQNVHVCGLPVLALPPTTCLDSTAYVTACNTDCQADLSTTKCTATTNTYCVTMYWNSPIGTNPPMSEFTCAPSPATYSVISAADVKDALSTATSITSDTISNSNAASITSSTSTSTSASTTGGTSSSSSSGLTHNDVIYIVVAIVAFLIVCSLVAGAIRRWRKPAHQTQQRPVYDTGYTGYQYPLTNTTSHASPSVWEPSYTPTTLSGIPEARSEIVPEDSVSQVNVPAVRTSRYTDLYSHAPTGSVGL